MDGLGAQNPFIFQAGFLERGEAGEVSVGIGHRRHDALEQRLALDAGQNEIGGRAFGEQRRQVRRDFGKAAAALKIEDEAAEQIAAHLFRERDGLTASPERLRLLPDRRL